MKFEDRMYSGVFGSLLRLFEDDMLPEFSRVFLVLDFAFDELLVLARPISLACLLVLELYE